MLRLLWACLRWDDMAVKPSAAVGTTRTGRPSTVPIIIYSFHPFSLRNGNKLLQRCYAQISACSYSLDYKCYFYLFIFNFEVSSDCFSGFYFSCFFY